MDQPLAGLPLRKVILAILAVTFFTGGILSWYASEHPDGLEWSIQKVTGRPELDNHGQTMHSALENLQEKTSLMPDYGFRNDAAHVPDASETRTGTTIAGIFGGLLVMVIGMLIGFVLKKRGTAA